MNTVFSVRLAQLQGWFYVLTGLWPVFHGYSFQLITGFKADFWLAQTVGLLLAASGTVLVLAAGARRLTRELALLGGLQALALAGVDFYCVRLPNTTPVYLVDAVAELALVTGWVRAWRIARRGANGA